MQKHIHDCADSRNLDLTLLARGRLKEARQWFIHRGWDVLPQNERGWSILQWVADHAWLGYPTNPEAAVRRICRPLAPWLSDGRLEELIETTRTSNKRWSHDQCAMVLRITVGDCLAQGYRFLGAADDPDYSARREAKLAKKAASARKRRAAKSSGRPRGRPRLDLTPEEKCDRTNAQAAKRMKRYRALRKNASPHNIKKTGETTEFGVTPILIPLAPLDQRPAPKAPGRVLVDVMSDEMIPGGVALARRLIQHTTAPTGGA